MVKKLTEEYNQIIEEQQVNDREQERVSYIEKGKEYLSKKDLLQSP